MLPEDLRTAYSRAGAWGGETLPQRLASVVARERDRVAIVDGSAAITFEHLGGLVERAAAFLEAAGVRPGETVTWQLPGWWEAAVVHHAILRLGAVPNPVLPTIGEAGLRAVLTQVRPRCLIAPATFRGADLGDRARALAAEHDVPLVLTTRGGTLDPAFARPAAPGAPVPSDPSAIALILMTSGTTGAPKGVLHTHDGLLCEVDSFPVIHGLTTADRYLGGAPVTHIAGLAYGLLAPAALGTSTVLLERWDPRAAIVAIVEAGATFQTGPPTLLQTLAEARGRADTSGFRLFSTGGARIDAAAVAEAGRALGCVVKRAYGSTEIPTLTASALDDDEETRLRTDGRPIGLGEVRIVGANGEALTAGDEGEIWGRAPEMLFAYAPEDAAPFAADGWFRTGDLGVLDGSGRLRVTGRIKDVIIRGGENVSAQALELLLGEHPLVDAVAVIGVRDDRLGERVCACVVTRDARLTLADLTTFLAARGAAKHTWPERLELLPSLPRTESGKVRKDELRARFATAS
ncbi:MAG TPA: AMP-binding protein [Actinomycetota bacterium]